MTQPNEQLIIEHEKDLLALEQEIEGWKSANRILNFQLDSLRTELSAKDKVLEFYADELKYSSKPSDEDFTEWDAPDVNEDNGEQARSILDKYKGDSTHENK